MACPHPKQWIALEAPVLVGTSAVGLYHFLGLDDSAECPEVQHTVCGALVLLGLHSFMHRTVWDLCIDACRCPSLRVSISSIVAVEPGASVEVRNMVNPGNKCGALFMTMSLKVRGPCLAPLARFGVWLTLCHQRL